MGEWGKCRSFVELYLQSFSENDPSNPNEVTHHKPTTVFIWKVFNCKSFLVILNCKNR